MKKCKKLLAAVLAFAMMVSLTACFESAEPVCEHEEVIDEGYPATCTKDGLSEGKHCAKCNEVLASQTTIPALGHTTDLGRCTRCNKTFGIFVTDHYLDEFNQPTTETYITNEKAIIGTFSNTATNNSELRVKVAVDKQDVAFVLYEYGSHQVKNISTSSVDRYNIVMKTPNGTKYDLTGTIKQGGDRLFIDEKYESQVIGAFRSGGVVSFYIEFTEYTTTTYLFSVHSSNFAELYAILPELS